MPPDYVLLYCRHFTTTVYIDPQAPLSPLEIMNDPRIPEEKRELFREKYHSLQYMIVSAWDGREVLDGFYNGPRKIPTENIHVRDIVRVSGSSISTDAARGLLHSYRYAGKQDTEHNQSAERNVFSLGGKP